MNFNTPVLELDWTGKNPDNRIVGEPHTLSNRTVRSVATLRGPFFADSLIVMAGGVSLSRGRDYQLVELHQEATLKSGKEIHSVILILKQDVGSQVEVSYQALGGHYGRNDSAIANLFETLINDERPVAWSNVFNKPTEFNPTIHRHLLDDVYGFEPIVDYLERIKRAITLGQSSIVLEVVNSLLGKFANRELPKCLPSSRIVQYDALLYFLSRRKILNNIWVDTVEDYWTKGRNGSFDIDTSGYPVGTPLYWQFYKELDAEVTLISQKSGWIVANGGIVRTTIYVPSDDQEYNRDLYIGVKENIDDIDFKAVTYVIDINEPVTTDSAYGVMLMNHMDGSNFDKEARTYDKNDELRLWWMLNHY